MPNLETHCLRSLKRHGVEGRDIHKWLDEPARRFSSNHRQFRHDAASIKIIMDLFGNSYGRDIAMNIALDHIRADHKEEIRRNTKRRKRSKQIHSSTFQPMIITFEAKHGRGHDRIEQQGVIRQIAAEHGTPLIRLPKQLLGKGVQINMNVIIRFRQINLDDWLLVIYPERQNRNMGTYMINE
jgi:hypothetical protein